ncbi:protein phosphatase 2a regulatory b subunit (b56 family) protein, partial [Toxoplasma gondii TgCatPRC2]
TQAARGRAVSAVGGAEARQRGENWRGGRVLGSLFRRRDFL